MATRHTPSPDAIDAQRANYQAVVTAADWFYREAQDKLGGLVVLFNGLYEAAYDGCEPDHLQEALRIAWEGAAASLKELRESESYAALRAGGPAGDRLDAGGDGGGHP